MRGSGDAITAGCQSEDFFEDGIMNKAQSTLLEFPGVGHTILSLPETRELNGKAALGRLVRIFLAKTSRSNFLADRTVKETLRAYRVVVGGSQRCVSVG
jgi:hypothetical protein